MNDIRVISPSELSFSSKPYCCAVGANGFTGDKKEGDGATPLGKFHLRECWYRADRIGAPATSLPLRIITHSDGWCDDPANPNYNKHVLLPFPASHEKLWRDDNIYDIIVPLGYNDNPVIHGKGSAIFFHLAKPDYAPTLGCVGVILPDMLKILKECSTDSRIIIEPHISHAHHSP